MSAARSPGAAFYCVADDRYFLGAVGLVNSLRLAGHQQPIYICDCGLGETERSLLGAQATLVDAGSARVPWLAKTIAPLRHPHETMVLIDADMIVTRSLDDLIARASAGRVVAFEDPIDRFIEEWGELPGLGSVRPGRYLSSGLVAAGADPGAEVFALMEELAPQVDFERTWWRSKEPAYPYLYADQDLFNAILLSEQVAERQILRLPGRLASVWPYVGLRVIDGGPACVAADSTRPYLLHQLLIKPWLERMPENAYSRILRRLLSELGPIAVPERLIPVRLQNGRRASLERLRTRVVSWLRWHLGMFVHRLRLRVLGPDPREAR